MNENCERVKIKNISFSNKISLRFLRFLMGAVVLRCGARFPGGVAPTNLMYASTAPYIKWIFRARLIPKESAPPLRTTMVLYEVWAAYLI